MSGRRQNRIEPLPLCQSIVDTLWLLAHGYTYVEVGAARGVTFWTVRAQVVLAMQRLGATNRVQAVFLAERAGYFAGLSAPPPPRPLG